MKNQTQKSKEYKQFGTLVDYLGKCQGHFFYVSSDRKTIFRDCGNGEIFYRVASAKASSQSLSEIWEHENGLSNSWNLLTTNWKIQKELKKFGTEVDSLGKCQGYYYDISKDKTTIFMDSQDGVIRYCKVSEDVRQKSLEELKELVGTFNQWKVLTQDWKKHPVAI